MRRHRFAAAAGALGCAGVAALSPLVTAFAGLAKGPFPRFRSTAADLGVRVTDPMSDGATTRIGRLEITCFHLPGHTAGSAAWKVGEVLYLGDSAALASAGALRPAAWVFTDDGAQNRRSVTELARRIQHEPQRPAGLAFGHSGPAFSGDPLVALSRARPAAWEVP